MSLSMPTRPQRPDPLRFADRMLLFGLKEPLHEKRTLLALRKATPLVALGIGWGVAEARSQADPLVRAHARILELETQLRVSLDLVDILGARWDKMPERRRPHYTPGQRWRILEAADLRGDSIAEIAHPVRVTANTIRNWKAELALHPGRQTIGTLVKPDPPVRRYADAVRYKVQMLGRLGLREAPQIAGQMMRAGWRLSAQTVRRILAERPAPTPPPRVLAQPEHPGLEPVHRSNQRWLVDISEAKALFGLVSFRIATVIDAFSRLPLATRAYRGEPSARDMVSLLRGAVRRHGRPGEVVTDRGGQFRAGVFQKALRQIGVRHRFGRLGQFHSLPLIERWWRTLKDALELPRLRPLLLADLQERLGYAVLYLSFFRPHAGLRGATPAEALFGWPSAQENAIQPPRGRPGEAVSWPGIRVLPLDPQGRYPVAFKAA